jgi:hypothetical protein
VKNGAGIGRTDYPPLSRNISHAVLVKICVFIHTDTKNDGITAIKGGTNRLLCKIKVSKFKCDISL